MSDFYELHPDEQARRLAVAGHQALKRWGIDDAQLRLIKYRENAVFEASTDDVRYALRIHRQGYHSDAALRSELQWMGALSEAGIYTPTVVPAQSGDLFITHSEAGLPGSIQIDVFEWVEGEQLGSVEEGVEDEADVERTYRTIGEIAARVHNQAVQWTLPSGFTRHAWDADGLAGPAPLWGQFWKLAAATPGQRDLLSRVRERLHSDLSQLSKSSDAYSLIHADFAPENLLVSGDQVRLIDFDDAGFGWHMFELSTSLYFIRKEPYYEQAKAAYVAGYRTHRPLPQDQLDLLALFDLARSTTYVGWVHTRQETETAQELTPLLLEWACELGEAYLT